jgi:N-acetylglucosamine kinase
MTRSRLRGYHGIDIGGTKIELVAFHDDEQPARSPPRAHRHAGHRLRGVRPGHAGLVARADVALDMRAAVGIGLPGVVDTSAAASSAPTCRR